jgi:hypothetical protein
MPKLFVCVQLMGVDPHTFHKLSPAVITGLPPRLRFLSLEPCDGGARSKINFDREALGSGYMR